MAATLRGAPMADEGTQYTFELEGGMKRVPPPQRRAPESAERALRVLVKRLHADIERFDPETRRLLHRYCSEVVLNIEWYDRARRGEAFKNSVATTGMVALMIIALVLLFLAASVPAILHSGASDAMLSLTVFGGGVLTILQVMASGGDARARMTIFWKASSDLKEALYTFEDKWRERTVVTESDKVVVDPKFRDALLEELRGARAITRGERLEFFATVRTPADVLSTAMAAADGLRGRRTDVTTALSARTQRIADATKAAADARGAVAAAEYRLQEAPSEELQKAARLALTGAKADLIRAEAVLHEISEERF
jgi:hypothetical protein